jgi:hypothetical protein
VQKALDLSLSENVALRSLADSQTRDSQAVEDAHEHLKVTNVQLNLFK